MCLMLQCAKGSNISCVNVNGPYGTVSLVPFDTSVTAAAVSALPIMPIRRCLYALLCARQARNIP